MWEIWHTFMMTAALFALFKTRHSLSASACIIASQIPFWAGVCFYLVTQAINPGMNLALSLIAAAGFTMAAHMFGRVWLAWLGVLFLVATTWDILALSPVPINLYVEAHEIFHYIALAIVVWRSRIAELSHHINRRLSGSVVGD